MKVLEHPEIISNDTIFINGTIFPVLAIAVVPVKLTGTNPTNIDWTYVNFTPEELLIQLDFEHLNNISSTGTSTK